MRVLIIVPEQDRISGNWITAHRFRKGLENNGHQVLIQGVLLAGDQPLREKLIDFSPEVVLLLHAFRSGKPWLDHAGDLKVPVVTMLTGTDINQGAGDPLQRPVIARVLQNSSRIVLQNPLLEGLFHKEFPELSKRLQHVPPGISLGHASFNLRERLGINDRTTLFLCPAGIRPVKMQKELILLFNHSLLSRSPLHLAFCGPGMDNSYHREFQEEVAKHPWASYLGPIDPEAMPSAMRQADVIVNNSLVEGLSNSLAEAASLGIPILARDNPGNAAVVKPNVNGLLYDGAVTFREHAQLLCNPEQRKRLSRPATDYDAQLETAALQRVLMSAATNPTQQK